MPLGRLMKKLVVAAVALALFCESAGAASHIALRADTAVQRWQSPQRFGRDATLVTAVYVRGRPLSTTTVSGCVVNWAGMGVAVRANTCGSGSIRLSYVSFGHPKRFVFQY